MRSPLPSHLNTYDVNHSDARFPWRTQTSDYNLSEFYASLGATKSSSLTLHTDATDGPSESGRNYRMSHLFKPVLSGKFNILSMSELSDHLETQLENQKTTIKEADLSPCRLDMQDGIYVYDQQCNELCDLSDSSAISDQHVYDVCSIPSTPTTGRSSKQSSPLKAISIGPISPNVPQLLRLRDSSTISKHVSSTVPLATETAPVEYSDGTLRDEGFDSRDKGEFSTSLELEPESTAESHVPPLGFALPSPSQFMSEEISRCLSQRFQVLLKSIVAKSMLSGYLSGSIDTTSEYFFMTRSGELTSKALEYQKFRIRRAIAWALEADQWNATVETTWSEENQLLDVTYALSWPRGGATLL